MAAITVAHLVRIGHEDRQPPPDLQGRREVEIPSTEGGQMTGMFQDSRASLRIGEAVASEKGIFNNHV